MSWYISAVLFVSRDRKGEPFKDRENISSLSLNGTILGVIYFVCRLIEFSGFSFSFTQNFSKYLCIDKNLIYYSSSYTLATFVVMNIASYRAIIASFNQPRGDSPRKLNYHTWGSALWGQRVFGGE